jgi:hypothetical protein
VFASEVAAALDRQARELAASFRPQLAQLDREIETQLGVVAKLKQERREVESALKRLSGVSAKPGPKVAKSPQSAAGSMGVQAKNAVKLENTRRFLSEHAGELSDGFTGAALAAMMNEAGIEPAASPEKVRTYIEQFRNEGILRADRMVKGGGMSYKLVSANGASPA